VRRERSRSKGGHRVTRAGKLSLPLLYNQYANKIVYHIRAGSFTIRVAKRRIRNEKHL